MGTMQLDENGFWIDPVEMTLESIEGTLSGESLPEPDLPPNAEGNSQKVPGTPLPPLAFESKPDREVWASYEDWPDRRSTNQQVKVPNSGRMSNRTGRLIPAGERIPKTTSGSLYSNFNRDRQEASRLQRLPKGTGQVSGKSTRPATTSQRFRHLERGMNTVRYNDALIPPRIAPFPFRVPNH